MSEYAAPHQAAINVGVAKASSDIGRVLAEGAAALKNQADKEAMELALKNAHACKPWRAVCRVVNDGVDFVLNQAASNPTLKAGVDKVREHKAALLCLVRGDTAAMATPTAETDVCGALADRLDQLQATQANMAAWLMALNLLMNVVTAVLSVMDLRRTWRLSVEHQAKRADLRTRLDVERKRLDTIDDQCLSLLLALKVPGQSEADYTLMELKLARVDVEVVRAQKALTQLRHEADSCIDQASRRASSHGRGLLGGSVAFSFTAASLLFVPLTPLVLGLGLAASGVGTVPVIAHSIGLSRARADRAATESVRSDIVQTEQRSNQSDACLRAIELKLAADRAARQRQ